MGHAELLNLQAGFLVDMAVFIDFHKFKVRFFGSYGADADSNNDVFRLAVNE